MSKEIITRFYQAFEQGDAQVMTECYSDNISFEDPAFGKLKGDKAKMMWHMLLSKKDKKPSIEFKNVESDGHKGKSDWIAKYNYGPKNRKVVNNISAEFIFENDKIIAHKDTFDLWKWSRQALGVSGLLLGWSPFIKNKIQATTNGMLNKYMAQNKK
ncbi:nuclear transport factor 2 family protein [bacterium]|nr:nuclear transport factor 2 family protein [bacterium]